MNAAKYLYFSHLVFLEENDQQGQWHNANASDYRSEDSRFVSWLTRVTSPRSSREVGWCVIYNPPDTDSIIGFPGGSDGKVSACNEGDPGSTPGSERSPGEGSGNPLQYSCLENPMDRGAWYLQSMESQRVGHD